MINPEIFLSKLEGVLPVSSGRWRARCPAHRDTEPSLQVTVGRDGDRLLVRDWGGCSLPEVLSAMGANLRDLFETSITSSSPPRHYRVSRAEFDNAQYLLRFHRADQKSGYQMGPPTAADVQALLDAASVVRQFHQERGL